MALTDELIIAGHRNPALLLPVTGRWMFDDPILGTGLLDRLTNTGYQIDIECLSYREKLSPYRRKAVLTATI